MLKNIKNDFKKFLEEKKKKPEENIKNIKLSKNKYKNIKNVGFYNGNG